MTGIKKRLGSLLGPEGRIPQFVEGATTQLPPSEPAKIVLTKIGEAQYRIDAHVPKGLDGDPTAVADFGEALAVELTDTYSPGRSAVEAAIAQRTAAHVSGQGVGRIVTSFDPHEPIEDGDLLLVLKDPRPQFFTDFSRYEIGDGVPADWSRPWAEEDNWSIVYDPTVEGGRFLRANMSGGGRNLLVWDAMQTAGEQFADQEVVVKWRTANPQYGYNRTILRGSGSAESETGYTVGAATTAGGGTLYAGYYENGVGNYFPDTLIPLLEDTWYITRTRIEGSKMSLKHWLASDPEPTDWDQTYTTTDLTESGFAGILSAGRDANDYAFFGVGFDGATAPMQEVR